MKLLITIFIFLNFTFLITAQVKKDIVVMPGRSMVQQVDRMGMQVLIELDGKFITKNWLLKLKEFGKVETDKADYIIHGAVIPDISSACTIYSNVTTTTKGVFVFWAIDLEKKLSDNAKELETLESEELRIESRMKDVKGYIF